MYRNSSWPVRSMRKPTDIANLRPRSLFPGPWWRRALRAVWIWL